MSKYSLTKWTKTNSVNVPNTHPGPNIAAGATPVHANQQAPTLNTVYMGGTEQLGNGAHIRTGVSASFNSAGRNPNMQGSVGFGFNF